MVAIDLCSARCISLEVSLFLVNDCLEGMNLQIFVGYPWLVVIKGEEAYEPKLTRKAPTENQVNGRGDGLNVARV